MHRRTVRTPLNLSLVRKYNSGGGISRGNIKFNSSQGPSFADKLKMGFNNMNQQSVDTLASSFSDFGSALSSVGSIAGGVTSIVDSALQNAQIADTLKIQNSIAETATNTFQDADSYDDMTDAWGNINFQKSSYTQKDLRGQSGGELALNTGKGILSGAMAGASVGGPWGAVIGGVAGLGAGLAGIFTGNAKARREAEWLNNEAEYANTLAVNNYNKQINSINENNAFEMIRNIAKDGGRIYIKPSRRGTFIAAARKRGMGVQEFARKVLANKDDYSSAMVKKANFARNFGGRKKDFGGFLSTHGGDWTNSLQEINEGSSHELNPLEGVPMGTAPDGLSNLVEEGEVLFNDYVFSDRLSPKKKELREAGLPAYDNWSYARIAETLGKESRERPNDPISRNGLESSMERLRNLQEMTRYRKHKAEGRKFASGGDKDTVQQLNQLLVTAAAPERLGIGDFSLPVPIKGIDVRNNPLRRDPIQGTGYNVPFSLPSGPSSLSIDPSLRKMGSRVISLRSPDYNIPSLSTPSLSIDTSNRPRDYYREVQGYERMHENDLDAQVEPMYKYYPDMQPVDIDWEEVERKVLEGRNGVPEEVHEPENRNFRWDSSYLRYAPVVGNAIGALASLVHPDYENAEYLRQAAADIPAGRVRFNALNNYYRPRAFDRNYYLNQLKSSGAATRRAIRNSGGNPGSVMAGLLAANYNEQANIGDTLMQMDMMNEQNRMRAAEFNRGTDMFNSQGRMSADQANADLRYRQAASRADLMTRYAQMRELSDSQLEAMRANNIGNLFSSIGDIGWEEYNRNMANDTTRYTQDRTGSSSYKGRNGGMLTKRRRTR